MGTVINVITVLIGSTIGYFAQARFSEQLKLQMLQGIGLVTILIGVQMGLKTENILIPLGGILVGGMLGFWMKWEEGLHQFAERLGKKFAGEGDTDRFMEGFVMSSLIFCVGPMTILGSINDGLSGDYHLLAVKSMLDGFTSLALAASLGAGVFFSIITIIVVQGGLTVLASQMSLFFSPNVITETTAAGGIIIIGLGIVILEIRKLKITNFLPALIIVPIIVKLIEWIKP